MIKKNVLIIGSGSIAQRHIKNLQDRNFLNLDLYSGSKSQQDIIKKKFSKINIINKDDRKKNYDYIIYANASYERFKFFYKFYNINSKVYFEKPLACNILQSKIFKNKDNKITKDNFIAGFQLRAHPLLQKVAKIISKNKDKLLYCNLQVGQNLKLWRKDYDYSKNYFAKNIKYSGVLWELSHEIDVANFLFGKPKEIFARNFCLMKFKNILNDYSLVNLDYNKFNVNIIVDMVYPGFKRKYEFVFKDKIIILDLKKSEVILIKNNKKKILFKLRNFKRNYMFQALMNNFLSKKKNQYANFNDLLENNKLINYLIKSSTQKKMLKYK